jgi:acyl-coenzyme A thioesterase PaaI-like protein
MQEIDSQTTSLEALAASLRQLIEQVRVTQASAPELEQARTAVERATALLAPHAHPGPYMQAGFEADLPEKVTDPERLTRPVMVFPYSPVIGPRNPLSPPVRFEVHGGVVHGEVVFAPQYNGPPGAVHGGVIALVMDELLGYVNVANQVGAFTGSLSIRYLAMTPVGAPIHMHARTERIDGRKVFARGEMRHGDTLTAEAEGIFIRPQMAIF